MSILTAILPPVNFDRVSPIISAPEDEARPTAGPDFIPTAEEEAEAADLFAPGSEGEPDWDALADNSASLDAVCSGRSWL